MATAREGHVLRSCERAEEAEQVLRRALGLDSTNLHVLLALADLLVRRGELAEAIELYRVASRQASRDANTHLALASTLSLAGAFDDAVSALSAGLLVATERYTLWCAKARLLRKLGHNGEAIKAWEAALSEKPEQIALKLEIASDTCFVGLHSEALLAYREAINDNRLTNSQRHQASLSAGRLARDKLQKPLIAVAFFEQAAALIQEHIQGARELAEQYRLANRLEDARVIYLKILEQQPNDVAAMTALAAMRRLSGQAHEALPLIGKGLRS